MQTLVITKHRRHYLVSEVSKDEKSLKNTAKAKCPRFSKHDHYSKKRYNVFILAPQ